MIAWENAKNAVVPTFNDPTNRNLCSNKHMHILSIESRPTDH